MRTIAMIGILLFFATSAFGQSPPNLLNDFDAVLPQVAKGVRGGTEVETTILLVNPNSTSVSLELTSSSESLLAATTIAMASLERRELKLSEGELVSGWVRVRASETISVSAVIVTSETQGGQESVSQATVLAEPLASSVVIPVFYRSQTIQNTGIAVFFRELGMFRFKLFDASGALVAEANRLRRSDGESPDHLALFVNELFQYEPPENFVGWIQLSAYDQQARGFAAMALYTTGHRIVTAQSTKIDAEAAYILALKGEGLLEDLRTQYGFDVYSQVSAPNSWTIKASDEVARALERDPRVEKVEPSLVPPPLSL